MLKKVIQIIKFFYFPHDPFKNHLYKIVILKFFLYYTILM